jgi:hypothetical protein
MRNEALWLVLGVVGLATAGCSVESGGGGHGIPDAGVIAGVVKLGPIMPVCREGVPCDGIYKGAKVVVTGRRGGVVSRVTTDDKGEFWADVAPGTYSVSVEVQAVLPHCQAADVIVPARQIVRIEIDCDSGIR